jgi:hypothetical protein
MGQLLKEFGNNQHPTTNIQQPMKGERVVRSKLWRIRVLSPFGVPPLGGSGRSPHFAA